MTYEERCDKVSHPLSVLIKEFQGHFFEVFEDLVNGIVALVKGVPRPGEVVMFAIGEVVATMGAGLAHGVHEVPGGVEDLAMLDKQVGPSVAIHVDEGCDELLHLKSPFGVWWD